MPIVLTDEDEQALVAAGKLKADIPPANPAVAEKLVADAKAAATGAERDAAITAALVASQQAMARLAEEMMRRVVADAPPLAVPPKQEKPKPPVEWEFEIKRDKDGRMVGVKASPVTPKSKTLADMATDHLRSKVE